MKLLFELSGEHPTLPAAEVESCLKAFGLYPLSWEKNHMLVVEAPATVEEICAIAQRLALSHAIYEVLSCGSLEEIEASVEAIDLGDACTFSLQGRRFGSTHSISALKQRLGECICEKTGLRVDLVNSEVTLAIFSENQIYLCRRLAVVDRSQFEQRKSQHRPFSSPISLHPRVARALVNLAGITSSQTLMDPFCGTGGILLEAGILGAQVIGIDIKEKMIEGCRANLTHYGVTPTTLWWGDATTMDGLLPVDAIVTDLPYGRSTHVTGSRDTLYRDALVKMREWLKPNGTAVVGLPEKRYVALAEQLYPVTAVYPLRVHRSLTRYFCVVRPG